MPCTQTALVGAEIGGDEASCGSASLAGETISSEVEREDEALLPKLLEEELVEAIDPELPLELLAVWDLPPRLLLRFRRLGLT
jgi:hypothetical protein